MLVTGATGLLGRELLLCAGKQAIDVVPAYHSQALPGGVQLDVRRRDQVRDVIRSVRPDGIIHTAYRQDDWATTALGAVNVALAAGSARLVFVSTSSLKMSRKAAWSGRSDCATCGCAAPARVHSRSVAAVFSGRRIVRR